MSNPGFPMMPAMSSPRRRLKPIRMKTTVPIQKSIRFFIRILPAFFALVKPVSTIANPACIQNTSAGPVRNQTPNTSPFKTLKISSVIIVPPRFPEGNAHPRLRGLLSAGAEEHFLLILWYKKTMPGIFCVSKPHCIVSGGSQTIRFAREPKYVYPTACEIELGCRIKKGAATFCRSTFAMLAV